LKLRLDRGSLLPLAFAFAGVGSASASSLAFASLAGLFAPFLVDTAFFLAFWASSAAFSLAASAASWVSEGGFRPTQTRSG
jgi:hypothetical protein